jgi:hypothetical protein
VNNLLEFSEMRYAVIEALQIEPGPERFVIAYRTEQSLPHPASSLSAFPPAMRPLRPSMMICLLLAAKSRIEGD